MRTKARFPVLAAGDKAGHYESFYLKLVRPGGGKGAWIRHTIHKRPGEPMTCALWFVLFDADATGPRATKRQFGADAADAPEHSYVRVGDAVLGEGRATGSVSTDALEAKWRHPLRVAMPQPVGKLDKGAEVALAGDRSNGDGSHGRSTYTSAR